MNLPINHNTPYIMHIDLNSCFATLYQQLIPSLRDKPLVIAAYDTPNGCVVAPSITAKRYGIKTGMSVREARMLCRDVIVHMPDPILVRDSHLIFKKVLRDYSPTVVPKSIDEIVIDFSPMQYVLRRSLPEIAMEIKRRIRKELGTYVSCNIGISTNRFLAKLAASLHKPDGLDVINYANLEHVYSQVKLTDLCGINVRFQARLNACGIVSPADFLAASSHLLQYSVFKSIIGYHWYLRLRGYEVDDVEFATKSIGQGYALKNQSNEPKKIYPIIMKLCEKMGRRVRRHGYKAQGVHVGVVYTDLTYWHIGRLFHTPLETTPDFFSKALLLFNRQPERKNIRELSVTCYHLLDAQREQLSFFDTGEEKKRTIQQAVDSVNDKWGEFVLTPARMMGMREIILDRVGFGFGGIRELEDIYDTRVS